MELTGVLPPIPTPFEDGELAPGKLKDNFQKWNQTGLAGYLVLGSNGEAVYMNVRERLRVLEAARESIPESKTFIAGTGLESTRETISFTNQAAEKGADFALVVTPCYYKSSMKPEILYNHFVKVADSSRIPILLYNVPQFTGVNITPHLVALLSEHANIAGIKDSSGNIGQLTEIIHLCESGFAVFVGSAPVFLPALCVGAAGGILAVTNLAAREYVQIRNLFEEGKLPQALALQNRLTPLAKAVTSDFGIGGLKMAMDMAGYFGGDLRAPLQRPGPEVETELKSLLEQLQLE